MNCYAGCSEYNKTSRKKDLQNEIATLKNIHKQNRRTLEGATHQSVPCPSKICSRRVLQTKKANCKMKAWKL